MEIEYTILEDLESFGKNRIFKRLGKVLDFCLEEF